MDWKVFINEEEIGPLNEHEIATLITEGKVDEETLVFHESFDAWYPIHATDLAAQASKQSALQAKADSGSKQKLIAIVAGVVLLLGLIGFMLKPSEKDEQPSAEQEKLSAKEAKLDAILEKLETKLDEKVSGKTPSNIEGTNDAPEETKVDYSKQYSQTELEGVNGGPIMQRVAE